MLPAPVRRCPTAILEYATAANAVYGDCRAYGGMAAAAAGHATGVQTYRDVWPLNDSSLEITRY